MSGGRASRGAGERGFGLVELLVAIAILGIAVVGLLEPLTTLLASSDRVRKRTDVNALLVRAGEVVIDQGANSFVDCADASSYSLSSLAVPSGLQVSISSVESWSGTDFSATCTATEPGDARRVQRITLAGQTTDNRASSTLQVVKREP